MAARELAASGKGSVAESLPGQSDHGDIGFISRFGANEDATGIAVDVVSLAQLGKCGKANSRHHARVRCRTLDWV